MIISGCSRQKRSVPAADIEKPQSTRAGFAVLTAGLQIAVEMIGDFLIDSFEVKVVSGILIGLIHLPDTFGSVNDVEKDMSAARTTRHRIVADLKEEFGIIQAAGPASLAAHAASLRLWKSFSQL